MKWNDVKKIGSSYSSRNDGWNRTHDNSDPNVVTTTYRQTWMVRKQWLAGCFCVPDPLYPDGNALGTGKFSQIRCWNAVWILDGLDNRMDWSHVGCNNSVYPSKKMA